MGSTKRMRWPGIYASPAGTANVLLPKLMVFAEAEVPPYPMPAGPVAPVAPAGPTRETPAGQLPPAFGPNKKFVAVLM
uniref:Uncharacterized protein n=1 Tax=Chryseobacterium endophyticum TaxID=1854762 RepID=A0AAU6WSR7_9FLAO